MNVLRIPWLRILQTKMTELIHHSSKGALLLLNFLKASGFAHFSRNKYESHTNITHRHKMQNFVSITVFTKLLQDVKSCQVTL
jgi:hypothetical protein